MSEAAKATDNVPADGVFRREALKLACFALSFIDAWVELDFFDVRMR